MVRAGGGGDDGALVFGIVLFAHSLLWAAMCAAVGARGSGASGARSSGGRAGGSHSAGQPERTVARGTVIRPQEVAFDQALTREDGDNWG